jgi:molybdopterin-guanine dinucleotide biosynthesis protein B
MPVVISVIGRSNSGKTTLIEQLISELTHRGYKSATIKHTLHKDINIDYEGKDSFRHKMAGANTVVISSQNRVCMIKDVTEEYTLDKIVMEYLADMDIVLTEGYRVADTPKIEIVTTGDVMSDKKELFAIVSNNPVDIDNIPQFLPDNIHELVDTIENRFLTEHNKISHHRKLKLIVDNKKIALNKFVQELFMNIIISMVSTLKGVDNKFKEVFIKIE